jgi:hypothetical protein
VAITSGVKAGDRVLARPAAELADGTPVVVAEDEAAGTGTPDPAPDTSGGSTPARPAAAAAPAGR